ncbi:pleckstrin-like [Gigantopelta aegis]|uniref:pleckstrin-like n=1 Tax=Gigantopelta aegis TaxID=1735272 RepID=UPI001B88C69C|nr:pleckstrin-like [Gigantopelta aegis]
MDKENQSLRSGFLLTRCPNYKWKAKWYSLSEEQLMCHHSKSKSIIVLTVPLKGCSIASPCFDLEDVNPNLLFKISTPENAELYFQAGSPEDREGWSHAIVAVIRLLSTSQQISRNKMPFQDFRANASVSEIIGAIQDPDAGVTMAAHLRDGVVYNNCFTGSNMIDWLMRWSIVRNRDNGTAMAQTLLKLGHIQEVDLHDGISGVSARFNDGERLYKFTSINLGLKRNSFYDSTDDDSSSSEDEEEEDSKREKIKKGKVVKEAFLMKKKNLRKGWHVVKAWLREKPPYFQYQKASYVSGCEDQIKTKLISLEDSTVTEQVKPATASKGLGTKSKCARYRLCIRDKKGKCVTLQTRDDQEKCEWLSQLRHLNSTDGKQTKTQTAGTKENL